MPAETSLDADRIEALAGEIYHAAAVARVGVLLEALCRWEPMDSARDQAVAGGGWLVAFKFSHRPSDLERAVTHLRAAWCAEPTPARASNLASALLEWAWLPQRAEAETVRAHLEAVRLLEQALGDTSSDDPTWVTRATTLLGAYGDEVEGRLPGYDIDKTLDLGEDVVSAAKRFGVGRGEPENLLGGALIVAADVGHARGDLGTAVKLLREAVSVLPAEHPDRPARLSNLGSALMDRYERTGAPEDLAEAISSQRAAYSLLAPDGDLNRPLIANNLLNAALRASM